MNLSFGYSPILMLTGILVAGGLTWWTYRSTIPQIATGKKWLLGTLRFTSLAILIALLFEPLLQRERTTTRPPVLGIIVDASESMLLADSLMAQTGPSTAGILDRFGELSTNHEVRYFSFGRSLAQTDSLETVSFDESATDISAALRKVGDLLADEPPGAVILLSDGLHNAGTNPIHVAERFPAPVISVVHGDTTTRRDVRIVQLVTNEIAYAGTSVPLRVRFRNDGYTPVPVTVTLTVDGERIQSEQVSLPPDGAESSVDLTFDVKTPGARSVGVSISRLEGEVTFRNNSANTTVRVLEQKKSILFVAGAPSPDVASFQRQLSSDENISLETRIQKQPGQFFEGPLPDDLSKFDLLVAVGYPGPASEPASSRRLSDAVREGLPILFVLDRQTDLRAVQREWSDVLPSTVRVIRRNFNQASFVQTPTAFNHPIFDIDDRRDGSGWLRLPPVSVGESRWESAPGTTVLATTRVRGVTLDDPLLLVGRQAGNRSAALLGYGWWRWENVPDDLEVESERWAQVLSGIIQWLYAAEDDRLVRVEPAERNVSEGDAVILRGEVYDESLSPVSDASVTINLETPANETLPFEMRALGNGRYTTDLGSLPSGEYSYSADATRDNATLGSDSGTFSIEKRSAEYRVTRADDRLMEQLALRTGGTTFQSSQIDRIESVLDTLSSYRPIVREVLVQTRLWQRYPALILVLLFVSIEWFLRKRFGMV